MSLSPKGIGDKVNILSEKHDLLDEELHRLFNGLTRYKYQLMGKSLKLLG